jgi:hypothetical protein
MYILYTSVFSWNFQQYISVNILAKISIKTGKNTVKEKKEKNLNHSLKKHGSKNVLKNLIYSV